LPYCDKILKINEGGVETQTNIGSMRRWKYTEWRQW
jgi:hypothetical protein